MSGHSKWSNIKRKKEVQDSKRGKIFTKLARDITIAAREGGADISANPSLRVAVEKARAGNMPKENIQRAIDRGTGIGTNSSIVEAIYEGYGPAGVAFLVKCITDNKNRTVAEIRNVFTRAGGSLADAGSVAYIFNESPDKPTFKVPLEKEDFGKFQSLLDELLSLDDVVNVYHNFEN